MSDLDKLQALDPELADWWRIRRVNAWSQAGLQRPMTHPENLEFLHASIRITEKRLAQEPKTLFDRLAQSPSRIRLQLLKMLVKQHSAEQDHS